MSLGATTDRTEIAENSKLEKIERMPSVSPSVRPTDQPLDLDVILEEIGTFGKWQMIKFTFICIPIVFNAVFTLAYIFTAGSPSYR